MQQPDYSIQYQKYRQGLWEQTDGKVIVETPVALSVNGQYWLTFLCTPTDLNAMAAGFLYNEGIIHARQEIVSVDVCAKGDSVDVWVNRPIEKPVDWRRTTGCSGGVTSVRGHISSKPATPQTVLAPEQVCQLMGLFLESQELYRVTRGVHSSALSDGTSMVYQADDIGRHNTLDKIAGLQLLYPQNKACPVILTTGRISSEMLQKSARIGASVVISRTAANNTSIRLADELGISLIGYARRNEFCLYTHPEQITNAVDRPVSARSQV